MSRPLSFKKGKAAAPAGWVRGVTPQEFLVRAAAKLDQEFSRRKRMLVVH